MSRYNYCTGLLATHESAGLLRSKKCTDVFADVTALETLANLLKELHSTSTLHAMQNLKQRSSSEKIFKKYYVEGCILRGQQYKKRARLEYC